MTILDLQGMELSNSGGKPRRSGASKHCGGGGGGASYLSLLLC